MNQGLAVPMEAAEEIVFECPSCGQSMAIDAKAAGLVVNCTGCPSKVKIPEPSVPLQEPAEMVTEETIEELGLPDEQTRILLESLSNSQTRIQEMSEKFNEVQRRRAFLERMRAENLALFNEVNEHLAQIKSSYDRLVEIMGDAP